MAKRRARGDPTTLPLSRAQCVRLIGVSDRTFSRLESEGVIVPMVARVGPKASSFDGFVVIRAYLAHREEQIRGSSESSRDRKDRSQAELNELKLARERKELLPRDDVVLEGQTFVTAAIAKLRAVPSRLVRAGVIAAAAQALVEELLREVQDEMSRWSNQLDLLRAIEEEDACTARRPSPTGRKPARRRRS